MITTMTDLTNEMRLAIELAVLDNKQKILDSSFEEMPQTIREVIDTVDDYEMSEDLEIFEQAYDHAMHVIHKRIRTDA